MGRLLEMSKRLHALSMMERVAKEVEERCDALKRLRFISNNAPATEHMAQEVDKLCEAIKALPFVGNESSEITERSSDEPAERAITPGRR